MKKVIVCICLTLLIAGCSGPSGSENDDDDQVQSECDYDSDCEDGYSCSYLGECVLDTDTQPTSPLSCLYTTPSSPVLYVAETGSDESGNGSESNPYATITQALDNIDDGGTILVKPGLYDGRVRLRGAFTQGVTVRSEEPYLAQLRCDGPVITGYTHADGCKGITIEGFDIAHSGAGSGELVVHLDGNGDGSVSNITLRNNILHDSYSNDILKINNGISNVTVERNLFYNQSGPDEHIDINSAANILVQDNIFMNDFAGSERTNTNNTSSYIVIKDSNADQDRYTGSHNIILRRNIFLNWEGSSGHNFILLGEDGQDFHEAYDITIENNLMLGNSANVMRAPFGIKGAKGVIFRNNTITGDLPALAFAMRINREGSNPVNTDINFYNNIWSDPLGSMGAQSSTDSTDFSDTPVNDLDQFTLSNNLYWNNGDSIPQDETNDKINLSDDAAQIIANPNLADPAALEPPRWDSSTQRFNGGYSSTCEAFIDLAQTYGAPGSAAIDQADAEQSAYDDLLGNTRGDTPDIGAVEVQ
jgi:hypothetical protein